MSPHLEPNLPQSSDCIAPWPSLLSQTCRTHISAEYTYGRSASTLYYPSAQRPQPRGPSAPYCSSHQSVHCRQPH
uniref:Uncharacterized protein n=1 Tax=Arundo donax TaxID=35708 RepID=A0A0A9CUL1_ARUDO